MKKFLLAFLIAAAPFCVFAQLPSYLPTDGLVGWWPFNGNANDESGNGNDGSASDAVVTTDRFGSSNSAYQNGQLTPLISIPNISINSSSFACTYWIKYSSQPINTSIADVSHEWLNNGTFTSFRQLNSILGVGVIGNNGISNQVILNTPNPVDTAGWNHIVIMRANQLLKIYVNGFIAASDSLVQNGSLVASKTFYIGGDPQNTNQNPLAKFNGKIDDVGIWSRALTPEEITALYTGVPTDNNGGGSSANASVPAAISYQAVARNAQGQPLSDSAVQVRFTLLTDSLTGAAEYSESHSLITNSLGLFTTAFGAGTPETGTFAGINWASGSKYLKVELDAGNGFVDMGTQQLLSVPYSMRSNTSAKAGTIENAGLPVYADNAVALAGGLIAGQMYRTATGDLKIVY